MDACPNVWAWRQLSVGLRCMAGLMTTDRGFVGADVRWHVWSVVGIAASDLGQTPPGDCQDRRDQRQPRVLYSIRIAAMGARRCSFARCGSSWQADKPTETPC